MILSFFNGREGGGGGQPQESLKVSMDCFYCSNLMHWIIIKADFLCSYKVTDDGKLNGINVVKLEKFTKFQCKIQISLQSIVTWNYFKHYVRWKWWVVNVSQTFET